MHATRAASLNRNLVYNTPGAFAFFHRDMMLELPLIADVITIYNSRQVIVDDILIAANVQRLNHGFFTSFHWQRNLMSAVSLACQLKST
jgi:hypothetical protein